jgi:hypothetical protein
MDIVHKLLEIVKRCFVGRQNCPHDNQMNSCFSSNRVWHCTKTIRDQTVVNNLMTFEFTYLTIISQMCHLDLYSKIKKYTLDVVLNLYMFIILLEKAWYNTTVVVDELKHDCSLEIVFNLYLLNLLSIVQYSKPFNIDKGFL